MTSQPLRIDDGAGVWPPDNYTGEWAVHWPNRQLKYHAHYINGETDGEVLCYWDNGQIAQEGISQAGVAVGVWTDYHQDGMKYKETDYQENKTFTVRWFEQNGDVSRYEIWQDGIQIHKESSGDDLLDELDSMYEEVLNDVDEEVEDDDQMESDTE